MRLTITGHRVSIDTVCRVSLTDRHIRLPASREIIERWKSIEIFRGLRFCSIRIFLSSWSSRYLLLLLSSLLNHLFVSPSLIFLIAQNIHRFDLVFDKCCKTFHNVYMVYNQHSYITKRKEEKFSNKRMKNRRYRRLKIISIEIIEKLAKRGGGQVSSRHVVIGYGK